nr:right-handed parallel beta-helix repeat-containing protein [Methanobrevibacter arboriphilus]
MEIQNNYFKLIILLLIFIFAINGNFILNNDFSYAKDYNIGVGLNNNEIQNIIDNAISGSRIIFSGSNYNNISLVINKTLILISNVETKLYASSNNLNGESFSSVFYFKEGSNGSSIKGFNIIADDYGIITYNTSNVSIYNNKISNASKSGILIESSKNVSTLNNNITKNNIGVTVEKSDKVNIKKNKIYNNKKNGINVHLSNNTVIDNNQIYNNINGVNIENTVKSNITNNEIKNNDLHGIEFSGKTEKTFISKNNISKSTRGIYINSYSKNDVIISNYINNNIYRGIEPDDDLPYGIGILFGRQFNFDDTDVDIKWNAITENSQFSIRAPSDGDLVHIGANWLGSNDPKKTQLCHRVDSPLIKAYFQKTANGYQLIFYDGNSIVTNLASFPVIFYLNGKPIQISQVLNGVATFNGNIDRYNLNNLSVSFGKDVLSMEILPTLSQNKDYKDPYTVVESTDSESSNGNNYVDNNGNGFGNNDGEGNGIAGLNNIRKSNSNVGGSSGNGISGENAKTITAKEIQMEDDNYKIKESDNSILIITIILFLTIIVGYIFQRFRNNFNFFRNFYK